MPASSPRARADQLSVAAAGNDLVIHDRRHNHIHALNPTAAAVWNAADGTRDPAQLAADLGLPLEIVELTIQELSELDLLVDAPAEFALSRRQVVAKLAAAGIAATALPVIGSITGADATAAASICTPCDPGCYDACLCLGPCDPACPSYDQCTCDINAHCLLACNPGADCDNTCPQYDACVCVDICDLDCVDYDYCACDNNDECDIDCFPEAECDLECYPDAVCNPNCPPDVYDECACDPDPVCNEVCIEFNACECYGSCDPACETYDPCLCDGFC